jgi:hypothetical protein
VRCSGEQGGGGGCPITHVPQPGDILCTELPIHKDDDAMASLPAGGKKRTRIIMPAGPVRNSRFVLRRWKGMAQAMAHRVKHLYSDTILRTPTWIDGERTNETHRPLAANALLMQASLDEYFVQLVGTLRSATGGALYTAIATGQKDYMRYAFWTHRRAHPDLKLSSLYEHLFTLIASQYRIMDSRAFLRVHEAAAAGKRVLVSIRQ